MRNPLPLLLAALLAGCSGPLEPEDVQGVYRLDRIGDDPLPAILFSSEYHIVRVLSDTIILHSDGTGMMFGSREAEPLLEGFEPNGPSREESLLRFRVTSNRIDIEFLCPANASCLPPPHIVALKTRTGLDARYFQLRTPLVYSRVADAPYRQRGQP